MQKKQLILILILIIAFTGFFAHTYAQVRDTDIILSVSPENPNPNQNVTATLSSYSIDLDKANISWSVNGQETSMGIGKKSFYFEIKIHNYFRTIFELVIDLIIFHQEFA